MEVSAPLPSFRKWSEGGCIYRCTPCGDFFIHSVAFWTHAADVHQLNPKDYTKLYPDTRVKTETMICLECPGGGKEITYDLGKMTAHMMGVHDLMTLEQYYAKHVAKTGIRSN